MMAPAATAALASASHSAPMPPLGCDNPGVTGRRLRRQAIQQCQHRARRARTEVRAEHGIEAQRAFERRGIEVLFQQIVDIHAADAQQLAHVAPAELAYLPADAQQRQSI